MGNWFGNLGRKIARFMAGRYGPDEFNQALLIAAIVVMVLSLLPFMRVLVFLSWAIMIYTFFRMLSRNTAARYKERLWYLRVSARPKKYFNLQKSRWRDRKTHCYFTCRSCGGTLRVPKGKGKIRITCPHCRTQFSRKT